LVCFSFRDHFENTGGAEQLQAYSLTKFLMKQFFFFVGIFFWLGTKRTQHQNIRVPGNNVRYLGVSCLGGVLRSALVLNLHMICLTC
jgi:hypothetical protein